MRMAIKPPSEWLRLLCRDWAHENEEIVAATDSRFLHYKSYLKGELTSQLLCRLSISGNEGRKEQNATAEADPTSASQSIDFWRILGVEDEFDRAHIVANIERFCSIYNIRGGTHDDPNDVTMLGSNFFSDNAPVDPTAAAAAAAAGLSVASNCALLYPIDPNAAVSVANMSIPKNGGKIRQTMKSQQRRIKAEVREREREAYSMRKAAEKAAREATREDRRQRKLAMRKQREDYVQKQKDAALRRAADLVHSNRVPIEITRGAAAAQAAANAAVAAAAVPAAETFDPSNEPPCKKGRSSIVISTASDLDQIVTHSNNLWSKYNAIAKEHNQKVNWIVVAKELGIHVKVREKYARMHARAKGRGFDFVNWGHYRIKDFPQYFLDPMGPNPDDQINQCDVVYAPLISPPPAADPQDAPTQDVITLAAEAAEVAGGDHVVDSDSVVAAAASVADDGQDVYSAVATMKHEEAASVDVPTIPECPALPEGEGHDTMATDEGHHAVATFQEHHAISIEEAHQEMPIEEAHHAMPIEEIHHIMPTDESHHAMPPSEGPPLKLEGMAVDGMHMLEENAAL